MNERARRAGLLLAAAYLLAGVVGYVIAKPAPGYYGGGPLAVLWVACALLGGFFLVTGRQIPLPGAVAPWVAPAFVGPLALFPLVIRGLQESSVVATLTTALLVFASGLPLAVAVTGMLPARRRDLALAAVPATIVGLVFLIVAPVEGPVSDVQVPAVFEVGHLLLTLALAWLPSLGIIRVLRRGRVLANSRSVDDIVSEAALLGACVGPAFSGAVLVIEWQIALMALAAAGVVTAVGAGVAIGPLARLTARSGLQRDLAVAASEAERTRLAGDLHDGPLQDLLLLARRLEARDDREGATLARDIADELREVSGDLRLPLLDDLGTGPALEWLATRVRRLTGLDVAAEWYADGRPPAHVELAAFRIAQEAVSNAVRHGRAPIRVAYRATPESLNLTIEDAGSHPASGIAPAAGRMRLGMLGMTQRAEQIGARLEIRRAASSGTIVAVDWQEAAAT
jgi:signal transduction histidine kinase